MYKIQFYTDRAPRHSLPVDLCQAMSKSGLIAPDQLKVQFCGFIFLQGGVSAFLPVNSDIKTNPELAAYWLLHSLNRFYSDKETGIRSMDGEGLIGGDILSLAISIMADYQSNGLYVRRNREYTINHGKVSWGRTVARQIPFPSGNAPAYLDLETSRVRYISDCETARIHAAVIKDICQKFGVLINGEDIVFDTSLELMPSPSGDSETQKAYLARELALSYSERDISLLKSLQRYLDSSNGADNFPFVIGTRKFYNVWESMLDFALAGEDKYNQKLPVPYYLMEGRYHETAQKGQRTDTVIHEKGKYAVVDAKYYSALTPESAPGWPDIVKQLFYHKAVSDVEGANARVTTHFVFPGNENRLISAHVSFRGQHRTTIFNNIDGYPVIHCHYCDPIELMKSYVSHRRLLSLRTTILSTSGWSDIKDS